MLSPPNSVFELLIYLKSLLGGSYNELKFRKPSHLWSAPQFSRCLHGFIWSFQPRVRGRWDNRFKQFVWLIQDHRKKVTKPEQNPHLLTLYSLLFPIVPVSINHQKCWSLQIRINQWRTRDHHYLSHSFTTIPSKTDSTCCMSLY